jgi:hypothetical protein
MVEDRGVEAKMKALATQIDKPLLDMTEPQKAAYELAHAFRDSFVTNWHVAG